MHKNVDENAKAVQALRLIRSSGGLGLTHLAVAIVSRAAPRLLASGLVYYAPHKGAAYALTPAGERLLREHSRTPS